jgi:hypothetical protein
MAALPMNTSLPAAAAQCPWCDQPITSEKLDSIHARIRAEERKRVAEVTERIAREKLQAEAKAKADVEKERTAALAAVEKEKREAAIREAALKKQAAADMEKLRQEAAGKEETIRLEAKRSAEAALAKKIAEAEEAKKKAEAKTQEIAVGFDKQLQGRLEQQREALEKDANARINAERAKSFEEKLKVETTLQDAQRQLQKLRSDELGEGAELDLYEELKATFEDDTITRVQKGTAGADIIHEVVENGVVCGKIVYDSKNHNAWRTEHVTKLRDDQIAAKADHAILSSNKFPAGERQIHLQDGVIIASPARVGRLAELLRRHVVQIHELRVGNEECDAKAADLYEFVTSETCAQLLDSIEGLAQKIDDVDTDEKKAHDAVWKKRGKLVQDLVKKHGKLCFEIDTIIGTMRSDSPDEES